MGNGEVMKLVLWNRLKQRRPQRPNTNIDDLREFYRMEIAIVWWMFGLVAFAAPLNWWGKKYRIVHDHYPWTPKRNDGTRGQVHTHGSLNELSAGFSLERSH